MGSNEMIGHDPLAWIKEEPAEAEQAEAPSVVVQEAAPAEVVEAAVVEEPVAPVAVVEQESVAEPAVVEEPVVVAPSAAIEQGIIELGDQLVISNVGKVRAEWMDRIVAGVESPIVIEGGDLQMVDTAGLQLVVALIRELNEDGVSWQWGGRSDLLQSSAAQLGITEMMSL